MNASAIDLDEATRTIVKDASGNTVVLSPEQVKRGKRLFNATCGACHVGGMTKPNPNVGLDPEALSLATPRRDNVEALVNYLKNQNKLKASINSNTNYHNNYKCYVVFDGIYYF